MTQHLKVAVRVATVSVWIIAGLLALKLVAQPRYRPVQPLSLNGNAKATPYALVLSETRHGAGKSEQGMRSTIAVRTDGSHVRWMELIDQHEQVSQREIQYSSGLRVFTDEVREVKSTVYDAARPALAALRDPSANCLRSFGGALLGNNYQATGTETILGHRVIKVVAPGREAWLARDLGCAQLRSVTRFGPDSYTEMSTVYIAAGEPPDELFRVREAFREVPPSRLYGLGGSEGHRRDAYYETHRPTAEQATLLR